ncbi:MAG: hypothetical protein JW904_06960 [Spirochaetales bacterium]|nr:hypothetical protein [Spirochaetales bacterium]
MKKIVLLLCAGCAVISGYAQTGIPEVTPKPDIVEPVNTGVESITAFRSYQIGMGIDQAKELLAKDPLFNHKDPDVYFLPAKEQTLIESEGKGYVKRIFLQFVDKQLFSVIIDMNENKVDYYSLFTTFQGKYGTFDKFTPDFVYWEKKNIRLTLEKPLTVKYLDLQKFNEKKQEKRADIVDEDASLKEFLDQF